MFLNFSVDLARVAKSVVQKGGKEILTVTLKDGKSLLMEAVNGRLVRSEFGDRVVTRTYFQNGDVVALQVERTDKKDLERGLRAFFHLQQNKKGSLLPFQLMGYANSMDKNGNVILLRTDLQRMDANMIGCSVGELNKTTREYNHRTITLLPEMVKPKVVAESPRVVPLGWEKSFLLGYGKQSLSQSLLDGGYKQI